MQFTQDQERVVAELNKWWNSATSGRHYTLQGSAGTGKSYTIAEWLKSLNLVAERVLVLTPTNKAAKVVRAMLSKAEVETVVTTIHSALGMILAEGQGSLKKKGHRVIKDGKSTLLNGDSKISNKVRLIIVDEISMVDEQLEKSLNKAAAIIDCKVLWVGDSYQLKPPGKKQCSAFERKEKSTLSKVVRYSGGALKCATKLRELIDSGDGKVSLDTLVSWQNNSEVERKNVFLVNEKEWLDLAVTNFTENAHDNIFISFRNSKVVERNQYIRDKILSDTSAFVIGERLVCLKPIKFKHFNEYLTWKNGETLEIVEVMNEQRMFYDPLGGLTKDSLEELTLDSTKFFNLFNYCETESFDTGILNIGVQSLDTSGYNILEIVDPEVIQHNDGLFEDLVDRSSKLDFFYRVRYLVEDYLNSKEPRFAPPKDIATAAEDLYDDLITRYNEDNLVALNSIRDFLRISKANYRYYKNWQKLKYLTYDINYAYSATSHKVQGSTYTNAFIDGEDIMTAPQWKNLMYVALTRATNNVYIKR
jgi:DNA polymerase III delta prime subunit